jgi:hypothetical protein
MFGRPAIVDPAHVPAAPGIVAVDPPDDEVPAEDPPDDDPLDEEPPDELVAEGAVGSSRLLLLEN